MRCWSNISVKQHCASGLKRALHFRSRSVAVFCKEERYQLRMHCLVRAEVSAEEPAYEFAVNRSIVTWEMYVFEASENLFEILSEFLYLGRLACAVQSFEYY